MNCTSLHAVDVMSRVLKRTALIPVKPIAIACALSGTVACATAPSQPQETRRVLAIDDRIIRTSDDSGFESVIHAASDSVWAALIQVYPGIGVEVKTFSREDGEIGNRNFVVVGRLAGHPLSNYVTCGSDVLGSQGHIDQAMLSLITLVRPAGADATRIETKLTGSARKSGVSTDPVHCTSTGALEQLIANAVTQRVAH